MIVGINEEVELVVISIVVVIYQMIPQNIPQGNYIKREKKGSQYSTLGNPTGKRDI